MTHLTQPPNPIFWQALGDYMRARIIEQVTEKPIEVIEEGEEKVTYIFPNGGQFTTHFQPTNWFE